MSSRQQFFFSASPFYNIFDSLMSRVFFFRVVKCCKLFFSTNSGQRQLFEIKSYVVKEILKLFAVFEIRNSLPLFTEHFLSLVSPGMFKDKRMFFFVQPEL